MNLKISKDFSLPKNAVTQKLAWVGTSGGGKTYGAMCLAEAFYDYGAQFVVLDPVGVWYGLRLDKSGKKPSDISIPIFGGLHGDIPLESTSGKLMADLIVDKNLTVILDVSQFESDAEKARFATDFADRFFFRRKSAPAAGHLFLEECQEFIPQNPQREENRMLHAFVRLQKIGRNFGIGTSLITQRPQEVSKKALNLAGTLFAFRTTGTHERKAIEVWMQDNSVEEKDMVRSLPSLETGCPHLWSPEWLKISKVVRIKEKRTFDASATPEVGQKAVTRKLSDINLEKIKKDMVATIEKSKQDDPRFLRMEIERLKKTSVIVKPIETKEVRVKVPVLKDSQIDRLEKSLLTLQNVMAAVRDFQNKFVPVQKVGVIEGEQRPLIARDLEGGREATPRPATEDSGEMAKGERAILIACAQHDGCTREHLTALTGYKRSSRDAYISRLQAKGYVRAAMGKINATQEGINVLGPDYEPLPTGEDLRRHLLNTLPDGEKRIFAVLVGSFPESVEREELSNSTGYKRSSRDAYLSRLARRELVDITQAGFVRASQKLF